MDVMKSMKEDNVKKTPDRTRMNNIKKKTPSTATPPVNKITKHFERKNSESTEDNKIKNIYLVGFNFI